TTHAAAAAIGTTAYVIGGRGPTLGTPTRRIVAIDPLTGKLSYAGALASPRSDLAAVAVGRKILLVGGRDARGATQTIGELVPRSGRKARSAPQAASTTNIYSACGTGTLMPRAR